MMNFSDPTTPGDRLKQLRKYMGWKQGDLIVRLKERGIDVGQSTVSGWENNEITPLTETYDALADIYQTSLDWLRCKPWAKRALQAAEDDGLVLHPDVSDFAQRLDKAPNGLRKQVLKRAIETLEDTEAVWEAQEERIRSLHARLADRDGEDGAVAWERKNGFALPENA